MKEGNNAMTFAIIRRPDGTVEGIAELAARFKDETFNVYFPQDRMGLFHLARLRPVRPEDMFATRRRAQEALAKARRA